jgi:hypothetical protein
MRAHRAALQDLVNGKPVIYSDTLRMVRCEGSRAPPQAPPVTRKPPVRPSPVVGSYTAQEL